MKDKGSLTVGGSVGTTIETKASHLHYYADPSILRNGTATSPSRLEINNTLGVAGETNDVLVAWELHTVNKKNLFEIREQTK